MVATIQQIIGKINPKLYAKNGDELLKKYGSPDKIPAEKVDPQALRYSEEGGNFKLDEKYDRNEKNREKEAFHTIVYDSSSETLEPIYFYIIDLLNTMGLSPKKYVDNFSSTPGSGHFAELGQRATIMQQQATKILGDVNTVLRSVLNIIYDLKEFKIRLQHYKGLQSKKSEEQDAATLSLKQIWMDKVDIGKGNSSIKAMALGQAGYQTLIDAFLIAKTEKDVDKIDLNDRVKRILKPRIQEFNIWAKESERELKKRYELEKTYLKSQVNSLKLYARWVKPYLQAAQDLESKEIDREPALVKTFNTILLELTILGKEKLKAHDEAIKGTLPSEFSSEKFQKTLKRDFYSCVMVDFKFRGIPQRVSQQAHYTFGGRAEATFSAYALNEDELKKLDEEMGKSEINDVLSLIEGATTESLGTLQEEINSFLEEKSEEEKPKDTSNPFFAMFGKYNEAGKEKEKKKEEKAKKVVVMPDTWIEANQIRPVAAFNAKETIFTIFDTYKKAHNMASFT